jgi:carbonic anhydrase/acetyltransferase-like protein (isoleucine patch superfamily)
MQVPPGSLVMGTPAKVMRALLPDEIADIRRWADHYVELGPIHRAHDQADAKNL